MLSRTTTLTLRGQQREETGLRLVDAALHEFIAHGCAGASARRITSAVRVSHGPLFHHYASTADMYAALVRLGAAEVEVNLEVALQDPLGFFAERAARMPATLRERPLAVRMFVFMDEGHSHPGLVPEAHALLTEADAVRASAPASRPASAPARSRPGRRPLCRWSTGRCCKGSPGRRCTTSKLSCRNQRG